jgi:hypothetical protein
MKKIFFLMAVILGTMFSAANTQAQTASDKTPFSDKGYWVVESNKKTPKEAIVYFYNNDNMLVYKEELKNQKLKLHKTKTLYRLKAALEEAISNSTKTTWASRNNLVVQHLQD